MIIKACDMEEGALDWSVAKALGGEFKPYRFGSNEDAPMHNAWVFPGGYAATEWRPSASWSQGGPLIEDRIFKLEHTGTHTWIAWLADMQSAEWRFSSGPTTLIASMRAIVASELGEEVDVPDDIAKSGG